MAPPLGLEVYLAEAAQHTFQFMDEYKNTCKLPLTCHPTWMLQPNLLMLQPNLLAQLVILDVGGANANWKLVDTCGHTIAAGPGPANGDASWVTVTFGGTGGTCVTCTAVDCAGSWGAWADAGNGGTTCADWKPAEETRQYTVTAEAVCGGSTANCVDAGDTCRWANDGACDVPSHCAAGTDDTDCGTPPTETQSGYDGPASCPIPETVCNAARICLIFYLQFTMQYM